MLLPLQKGVLYGPINSRRLGRSLGINLMPVEYKLCSFNCVYCHYGLTDVLACDMKKYLGDLPSVADVADQVEQVMKSSIALDYITFSGNGEPTLHPDFSEIVDLTVNLRKKLRPGLKIALLSNSTGMSIKQVQASIVNIDQPFFKLDAGKKRLFKEINRPAKDVDFDEIVESLKALQGIHVQTVLMHGTPSNVLDNALGAYFEAIAYIKPVEVQIYSLDRPVPNRNIRRVLPEELEIIALKGSKKTGIKFRYFHT